METNSNYITKNYPAANGNSVEAEKTCNQRSSEDARIQEILYTCDHPEEFIVDELWATRKYFGKCWQRTNSEHFMYLIVEVIQEGASVKE